MGERMVKCSKLGKEAPGLEKPPFGGELGKKIFENVSKEAWMMWKDMQLKIINEYRLNLGNPDDHKALMDQMLVFLNLAPGNTADVGDAEKGA